MSSDLTETIYAAVHAPGLWPLVADEFARALASPTVIAATERSAPSPAWDHGDLSVKSIAGPHAEALTGLVRRAAFDPAGQMEVVSPDLTASRPVLRRGDGQGVGEWLHLLGGLTGGSRLCHVAAARTAGSVRFADEDVCRFFDLAKHVLRAISMAEEIGREESDDVWRDAIDSMNIGVCVLAEDARLIRANAEGTRLLAEARHISLANGKLRPVQPEKAAEFQRLLSSLALGQDRGAVVTGDEEDGEEFLIGLVRSRERGLFGPDSEAVNSPLIAYMSEIEKDYGRLEGVIRQAYRLTRMEARTTIAVLRGMGIDEAAKTLGLSPATVRSHVKNVFSKTGVQRQSQLVHRTLGGVLSLLA